MAKKINSNLNLLEEIKTLGEELAGCISTGIDADVLTDKSGRYKLACIILESFPHAVCMKDAQGRFLVCNSAMLSLMNVNDPRNLIGRTEFDFKNSSEAQIWHDTEQKVIKTIQPCIDSHLPVTDSKGNQKLYLVTIVPITGASENVSAIMEVSYEATEQITAIKTLEESEKRYRTLFEGAAEGILLADVQTRCFRFANPAICQMLGYSESELKSLRVDDIHPKEELNKMFAMFSSCIKDKKSTGMDMPFLCKDGSIKYFYGSSTTIILDSRQCRVGFFTDMTKLKQAQQELGRIQKHLQLIFQNSFDGINICEVDTELNKRRLIFCNDKFVEMSGQSREELMAADNLNIFLLGPSKETRSYWDQCILDQVPFTAQASWIRPDKKENYFELTASAIKIDGRYYIVGVDRDITEQIKNHKQLKEAEARYRTLVERLPAILYVAALDENSTTLFISPQVKDVLGISPEQYKQNPDTWRQRLYPKDKERVMRELNECNSSGKTFCCEYRMFNSVGEIVWFRDEAAMVTDDSGKPLFLQGVMLDITDRKKVENELEHIKEDLESRILKRTFDLENLNKHLRSLAGELSLAEERTRRRIATMVHDSIGQNLGLTRIKLQTMINSPRIAEPFKEELKTISNLVAQMIDSARSLTFEISPPVLYELGFDAAVEWLLRQSRDRDGLITDFKSDGQSKKLEENLKVFLFQAVRELLINVTKHAKASHVDVSIKGAKSELCVNITDDGKGFDVEKKSSQAQNISAGFGLFSIRERIRLLNGSLVIQSKPGYGTKVMLKVPLIQNRSKKRGKK